MIISGKTWEFVAGLCSEEWDMKHVACLAQKGCDYTHVAAWLDHTQYMSVILPKKKTDTLLKLQIIDQCNLSWRHNKYYVDLCVVDMIHDILTLSG